MGMPQHEEYYALDSYARRCLCGTNYWRALRGEPVIQVPPEDTEYHRLYRWPEPQIMSHPENYPWAYCPINQTNKMETTETKPRSLMELTIDQLQLIAMLEESSGELTEEVEAGLKINKSEAFEKICAYQEVISHIDGKLSIAEAQIERLAAHTKRYKAAIERMKSNMLEALLAYGEQDNKGIYRLTAETENNIVTLSTRKSESIEITDKDALPADYWHIPEVVPTADKKAIKKALDEGIEVQGAKIIEKLNLVIK